MKKNTVIDNRFENFTKQKLSEEENQVLFLKNAIQEGINSGQFENFDSLKHLDSLKKRKKANYLI